MAASLKRGCGCAGTCDNKCDDACCFSAFAYEDRGGDNPTDGPCADFLGATSDMAKYTGFYDCVGYSDDEGLWTWPGGSLYRPASIPSIGPCYGANVNVQFSANMKKGQTMRCRGGSYGGGVGCSLDCCVRGAP